MVLMVGQAGQAPRQRPDGNVPKHWDSFDLLLALVVQGHRLRLLRSVVLMPSPAIVLPSMGLLEPWDLVVYQPVLGLFLEV